MNGCCLVCGKDVPELSLPEGDGWDMLSGYLSMKLYFCPDHRQGEMFAKLHAIGLKKPGEWTKEEDRFVLAARSENDRLKLRARMRKLKRRKQQ